MAFQAGVSVALQRAEDLFWRREVFQDRVGWGRMESLAQVVAPSASWRLAHLPADFPVGRGWLSCFWLWLPWEPVPPAVPSAPRPCPWVFSLLWGWWTESLAAGTGAFQGHQCFLIQPDLLALRGLWAHGGGFVPPGPEGYLPGSLSSLGARLGGQTADFSNWALSRPQTQAGVLPRC